MLIYFQDHYVEAFIDECYDFYVGLNIFQKNHHMVYITTMTRICVGSQGNVRESYSGNPVATLYQIASNS